MPELSPNIIAKEPKGLSEKRIKIDAKGLFKALTKVVVDSYSGRFEQVSIDASEALVAIGLETPVEERAFVLISRSLTTALIELVDEIARQQLIDEKDDLEESIEELDFSMSIDGINIDQRSFNRPAELSFLREIQTFLTIWLESLQVKTSSAVAIANRLPRYFVYALIQEWRKDAKSYQPIIDSLSTPFSEAGKREWAWKAYSSLLDKRIHEGIFDEPFGLSQVYVPLNAFYIDEKPGKEISKELSTVGRKRRRVVVSLENELTEWLNDPNLRDSVRVISGGPGSGKSSFARVFASKISEGSERKVLYVPLHLIDASKDLIEAIGNFVQQDGVLSQNPLDPRSPEPNLLIIFDGLDELASQGNISAEIARTFIREVDKTVERRSSQKLRVLISGRELVVQENESEFRRPRQILTLLPFFDSQLVDHDRHFVSDEEEYYDPENRLKEDLRQAWWKKYGELTGKGYEGLPKELDRDDLAEITAQPLLNYLLALAFSREKMDFKKDINLNSIYEDLIAAVHERGYEKYKYRPNCQMSLEQFTRILEEIGLASWHGDGRTTTVREIEKHCLDSGLDNLLDALTEWTKEGVARLLAAFFFRRYGQPAGRDSRFVFTHKSFGEYLTARRVMRLVDRVVRELDRHSENLDEGWNDREALRNWVEICGPSAISKYLHSFLLNEVKLRPSQAVLWQTRLAKLFSHMLRYGMPMEQLQLETFREEVRQSRNAEEALLVALNACARVTGNVSEIEHPEPTAFGAWFKRVQGQRSDESSLPAKCLSYLNLNNTVLTGVDFFRADLRNSNLNEADLDVAGLVFARLDGARLDGASLILASLVDASLNEASLNEAGLDGARLDGASLNRARLNRAILDGARLDGASLVGSCLDGSSLVGASLNRASLGGSYLNRASLDGASLDGASLNRARLNRASLGGSCLNRASLDGASLDGASLNRARLNRASLVGASLKEADLRGADLNEIKFEGADFDGANLEGAKNLPKALADYLAKKRDKQAD